ncbi:MAG TPA: sugar phosphate isomerase/epimerase family protein [Limnochordia bacterium]|nr:sugar phosphate isomerase/epimerase family protein [Limnochordia bacterium]
MKYHGWFKPQHDLAYAKRALQAGLHGFEIIAGQSHYHLEEFKTYRENIKRIKEELQPSFTVHAPITDINLGSINRRIREASLADVQAALELAREVEALAVAVHASPGILAMPGGKWSKETASPPVQAELIQQEGLLVQALQKLADYAPDVLICLENLVYPHELYRSPGEMEGLLGQVNRSNVRLTLDVGHAVVAGCSPQDFVQRLFDHIFHVHLHDNHGTVDEHLPLGQGTIDYVGVVQALYQAGYQGAITLEFFLDNPEEYSKYLLQFERVTNNLE